MRSVWQGRLTQVAVRYGEVSQSATVCCNACRTCVQTNVATAVLAVLAGAGAWGARRFRRATV